MNGWQIFWRSMDEARIIVRIMLFLKLFLLASFVYIVTQGLFGIVNKAIEYEGLDLGQVVAIIAGITAFATVVIPMLVKMYQQVWEDYRQSGTNWDVVAEREKLAQFGDVRQTDQTDSMSEISTKPPK